MGALKKLAGVSIRIQKTNEEPHQYYYQITEEPTLLGKLWGALTNDKTKEK